MSEYLHTLNEAQRAAVVSFQSPSLIIAGAGSGKTRVLTCRIAHMLEQGIPSHSILALTFTNKAAREMRERIATLVSPAVSAHLWMGTFHSIFARILRAESEHLGYPASFTIYDAADAKNLVKMAIKELSLSDETYKPNTIASRISKAKNNLVTPQAYEANASLQAEDREQRIPQFLDIYKLYTRKCRENGAMDFDDLLLQTNLLFRDHPQVLAKYQQQFGYILVDEYQDTNFAQYIIVRRLGELHGRVCVVGDDAQSIYSFRGAKIENILRFQQDFPKAQLFKLEQNYRSTQTIVNAANCVIEKNRRQIKKHSFSAAERGELIRVLKAYTDKEESSLIASDIYSVIRTSGVQYSDVAILYRTNAQSRALEESLRSRNIPYKIYGGMSFYQRKEIKDLLAYVRLVVNPRDDEALRRIINTPTRGIGEVTLGRIAAGAAARGISMWEAISTLNPLEVGLSGAAAGKVTQFGKLIGELSQMRATTEAYTLGLEIATRSGLIGTYKMQQSPESISALENIEELINSIRLYAEEQQQQLEAETPEGEPLQQAPVSIDEWLQNVALLTDMDNETPQERNTVTLMTVHAAKGLEFEYVYVAGLEENLFPSMMSMGSPEGLEEERRLFYVALTRAKRAAVLTFAESRFKWGEMTFGRPSRFLSEIDPAYLDLQFELNDAFATDSGTPQPASQGASRKDYAQRSREEYDANRKGSPNDTPPRYRQNGPFRSGRPVSSEDERYGSGTTRRSTGAYYPPRASNRPLTPEPIAPLTPQGRLRSLDRSERVQRTPESHPTHPTEDSSYAPPSGGALQVGCRVEHAKFGVGTIVSIEQWSGDEKLCVDFEGAGKKTLLKKFAKLHLL